MTVLEALQDIGKGRIIDNGCNYELIAIAKGRYTFHFWENGQDLIITLAGTPAENAAAIQAQFSAYCKEKRVSEQGITRANYTK